MSTTTADTYQESIGSCRPPSPSASPSPYPAPAAALRAALVRRQLDFAEADAGTVAGAGGDLDDYNDIILSAVDDIERGYNEAKRRAPQCICGRGECAVQRDHKRGRWMYVCPSQPKCNHVSVCEEVSLDPELQPAVRSHPKPSNDCVISISSNHVAEPRTPINNVNLRGAGATTPNIVSPQAAIPRTPLNSTFQSAGTSTPLHVSPKGPCATAVVKISPQGAGSNAKHPICKCNAGKCRVLTKGSEDYYVCPIPKGHGACSYMAPVVAVVNEPTQTGTRGDKHLKVNLVEKEDTGNNLDQAQDNNANGSVDPPQPDEKKVHGNNLVQAQDNNANGSVNPPQPDEKEVHGNNLFQAQDNNANGSVNSQSNDEWPFEVVDNEIVFTAQTTTSTEVHQASPSVKCETTAMAEAPTESPVPPYDTSSLINPRSENPVSPAGRILQACGELMISCCSGLCPP